MIIEKLELMKDFTNSEKQIAKYILKNIKSVLDLHADELAACTYTSKASVIRFCKKIEPEGYHAFKREKGCAIEVWKEEQKKRNKNHEKDSQGAVE